MSSVKFSSYAFVCWKSSRVSIRICRTLGSRRALRSPRTVSTNFWSKFRVKVEPGLSVKIRRSMIALYCHDGLEKYSLDRYLRIRRAHSAAAAGEDSAASTMGGRKRTSSSYFAEQKWLVGVYNFRLRLEAHFGFPSRLAECFLGSGQRWPDDTGGFAGLRNNIGTYHAVVSCSFGCSGGCRA